MNGFLKAAAAILIAAVLCLVLSKRDKDIALLMTTAVCCMVLCAAVTYLEPVVDFIRQLQNIGDLDTNMLGILMKSVGIGLLTEITVLICADTGNAALGKSLQILAIGIILWISLPLLSGFLSLIAQILGEI